MEDLKTILDDAKNTMDKCIVHTEAEFAKIRAGKAMPNMLDSVSVDYYGAPTPLSQAANISTPDARTIVVQPWDKSLIGAIEKAITDANLGLNPQNDGIVVRINVPPLTEERRKVLVKNVKNDAENARITIRNIRKDANERLKKSQKDGMAEDIAKDGEAKVQVLTDQYIKKIDELFAAKEKEIMTV
ncbi:MAG TPA: ribosome recycling factor [Bacteroidia bacterium]|nr:ribosome recycling factor [Bacteroidia bacterium]